MGANLARNIESRGFAVAGYDLDAAKTQGVPRRPGPRHTDRRRRPPEALAGALERPRRVLMMVPAGPPVDSVIAHLAPHLDAGDILIDGGNSLFVDTDRRTRRARGRRLPLLGTGVSGGEEGALRGPAIMPGGSREAWDALAPIFRAIAAKADDGEPCVAYMGPRGAGHYVKMVHNGIEYGDMQLIAEAYDLLHRGAGVPSAELAGIFAEWNDGELQSYLVEITARDVRQTGSRHRPAARRRDPRRGAAEGHRQVDEPERVRRRRADSDGQRRGRGAHHLGAEDRARRRQPRARRADRAGSPAIASELIDAARQALYASKITSYAQGMALLRMASAEYGYDIHPGEVAQIWRAGCIIRAALLGDIRDAFRARQPALVNLLLDAAFATRSPQRQEGWRHGVQTAIGLGIPVPGHERVARLLRRLPQRAAAGQPDAGAARLLRRPHLPPRRSRRRVPHGLG